MADFDGLFHAMIAEYGLFEGEFDRLATVKGWAAVESSMDPWAIRYEPQFYRVYMTRVEGISRTERRGGAFSWGLFQLMGQTAREFGFDGTYLPELCDPVTNCDLAGKVLRRRYDQTGSWDAALASFNGGLRGNRTPPLRRQSYVNKVRRAAERFR